jgi:Arc/MetJ-type ribon-helix-helix transcriptional regulator
MSIKNNAGVYAGSKITANLKSCIDLAVRSGIYLNISEFVRTAIKEKLMREGYLSKGGKGEVH